MNDFQICLCGAMPGYPHAADCPRPSYNANDDAHAAQWEADRASRRRELDTQASRQLPRLDPLSDGP